MLAGEQDEEQVLAASMGQKRGGGKKKNASNKAAPARAAAAAAAAAAGGVPLAPRKPRGRPVGSKNMPTLLDATAPPAVVAPANAQKVGDSNT